MDGQELKLICYNRTSYDGLASTTRHEFYLWNSKLIFTFFKQMTIAYADSQTSSLRELRGYYQDEQLNKLLSKELEHSGGEQVLDSLSRYANNKPISETRRRLVNLFIS